MCSILGGTVFDERALSIYHKAKSRGRDQSNLIEIKTGLWIANHRAIPTTELQHPKHRQPFGQDTYIVHNGVIANDKELGLEEGEIDSSILPKVLDTTSIASITSSLEKVEGSYALGIMDEKNNDIILVCNYKPIWIAACTDGAVFFSSLKSHFDTNIFSGAKITRVEPYSAVSLKTGVTGVIRRKQSDKALVIASGGLDSSVVASVACAKHSSVDLLHFQYGCKAEGQEVESVKQLALALQEQRSIQVNPVFLELPYKFAKDASTLLQDNDDDIVGGVEGTEYAHEWVPARNLVMLSLATAYAEANNIGHVYLGTNLEEGGAYPDNEEQFIEDFRGLLWGAVQNGVKIDVHTPLGGLMKHEIVKLGMELRTPFENTYSCYKGHGKACGQCGPCFMRQTAFHRNGALDPVEYEERIEVNEG